MLLRGAYGCIPSSWPVSAADQREPRLCSAYIHVKVWVLPLAPRSGARGNVCQLNRIYGYVSAVMLSYISSETYEKISYLRGCEIREYVHQEDRIPVV